MTYPIGAESFQSTIIPAIEKGQGNIFAVDIQDICQTLLFQIFQNWNQILRLKAYIKQNNTINTNYKIQVLDYISVAVAAVDHFNTNFRPFLQTCLDNFELLQHHAQVASGKFVA